MNFMYMELPPRNERHLRLRFDAQDYNDSDIHDFESRLSRIYDRHVKKEHVLDFDVLVEKMEQTRATLTKQVANLEHDNIAQATEITKLKQRVRRLEKKRQFKSLGLKRLRKARTAQMVESSVDTGRLAESRAKANAPRRRRGVVIQDPEETTIASVIVHTKVKSKDKGKGILIEEPKPLKRQAQIKQDKAFARQLEVELNENINWDDVIEQVKRKEK
nr:hypothetical protein [Tanacetum cinerariifolium]